MTLYCQDSSASEEHASAASSGPTGGTPLEKRDSDFCTRSLVLGIGFMAIDGAMCIGW